jgi:hypothetical protein
MFLDIDTLKQCISILDSFFKIVVSITTIYQLHRTLKEKKILKKIIKYITNTNISI